MRVTTQSAARQAYAVEQLLHLPAALGTITEVFVSPEDDAEDDESGEAEPEQPVRARASADAAVAASRRGRGRFMNPIVRLLIIVLRIGGG